MLHTVARCFPIRKMGAKMEAETRIAEVWFYADSVCTSLSGYVCSFHLNKCLQLRVVMLLSLCLRCLAVTEMVFSDGSSSNLKQVSYKGFWPQDTGSRFQSKRHPQDHLNILNPQLPGETSSRSCVLWIVIQEKLTSNVHSTTTQ